MIEAALALILVALSHAARARHGLNMADEGYLWHGTLRIGQGLIPIRDYKSYDPARFYWCWGWMKLFGTGILGLRRATAVFQALGLWAGLSVLGQVTGSVVSLALAGLVLAIWMQPRHKGFEHGQSLITAFSAVTLLAAPSPGTALLAGVLTGLAGFMGRNHGAYALAATGCALIYLALKTDLPGLVLPAWAGGIVLGYAPMLAMFALIPGMARRYLHDKVLVFWRRGGIDLPRRAPLPWRVRYAGLSRLDRVSQALVGLHFLIVPLYCAGVLVWALLTPGPTAHPALVGAALVGLFHAHHAMSRSDLPHLCQGIQPGLLAILAGVYTLAAPPLAWVLALALTGVALLVIRRIDPALQALEDRGRFVPADIRGERLWLPAGAARQISRIQALIETHLTPDEPLFIAPDRATLYPLLGRPAPVRSDMMIFPETEAGQDEIVAALDRRGVNWALVWDAPRDGRDELRFSRTHAKVWAHLDRDFEPVPTPGLKVHWAFRKRRMQETET